MFAGNGTYINPDHQTKCSALVSASPDADNCHFYDQCVEPYFMCGTTGFVKGYAEKRCRVLKKLKDNSLSDAINEWAYRHENCLREKLLLLVKEMSHTMGEPHRPLCLDFEIAAFQAVEECYNQRANEFCSIVNSTLATESDVLLIRNFFSLNSSYYNHTVNRGLITLLDQCEDTKNISTLLRSHFPRRKVICARHSTDANNNPPKYYERQQYIQNVSSIYNISEKQLVHNGIELASELKDCFKAADSHVIFGRVHVLLYSAPSSAVEINPDRKFYGGSEYLSTWEAKGYERVGECGDGRRQATEMCDTGIYHGVKVACSLNCETLKGFECYSEPLEESSCKVRECGNGDRTGDEECEDNNNIDGDGCSSNCTIEPGWTCTPPSPLWSLSNCKENILPSPSPSPSLSQSLEPSLPQPTSTASQSTNVITPSTGPKIPIDTLPTSYTALIIVGALVGLLVCASVLILVVAVACFCTSSVRGDAYDTTDSLQVKTAITEEYKIDTRSTSTSSSSDNLSQPQLQPTME